MKQKSFKEALWQDGNCTIVRFLLVFGLMMKIIFQRMVGAAVVGLGGKRGKRGDWSGWQSVVRVSVILKLTRLTNSWDLKIYRTIGRFFFVQFNDFVVNY